MKNIIRIGSLLSRLSIPKLIVALSISLLITSCEWVHDDESGCLDGTWLKVVYTYNILDVDAALNQVEDLSILFFDNTDTYLSTQSVSSSEFQKGDGVIGVDLPLGTYNIMVIGGLEDENYLCSSLTAGDSTLDQVTIQLQDGGDGQHSSKLSSLFYGYIEDVEVLDGYQLFEVPLVKNSNDFSCILQCASSDGSLDPEDFTIRLVADNSILDYQNNVVESSAISYYPYQQQSIYIEDLGESDTEQKSIQANINTLRLMKDDQTRFEIIYTPTEQTIIDIPLTTYLLLSGTYYYAQGMGEQEFLDRQDAYALIFYLEEDEDEITGYICNQFSVNSWIVRMNEITLKKEV